VQAPILGLFLARPARGASTAAPDVVLVGAGKVRVSVPGNNGFGALRARWLGADPAPAPALGVLRRGKGTTEGLRPGTWEIKRKRPTAA
jgi:hypothetical protein